MPITYIERDTASGLTNTGGDTEVTEFVKIMNETLAASVNISYSIAKAATERLKWITELNKPNQLDWANGTYTWEFEVLTANSNLSIVEVILRRLSSDGVTVRASKSSGAISVGLGTTGVKSGTITWDNGTQNPAGRQASDRLEIVFRVNNANAHSAASGGVGMNTVNNELATPLGALFTRTITETTSISETLARVATKLRGLTETTAISETLVKVTIKPRSITETTAISETLSRLKSAIRTITETTAISETLTRTKLAFRTLTETIPVSETLSRVATKVRSIAVQTVAITETLVREKIAGAVEVISRHGRPLTEEEERIIFRKPKIVKTQFAKVSRIKVIKSKFFKHQSSITILKDLELEYHSSIPVKTLKALKGESELHVFVPATMKKESEIVVLVSKPLSDEKDIAVKTSNLFYHESKPFEVVKDSELQEIVKVVQVAQALKKEVKI